MESLVDERQLANWLGVNLRTVQQWRYLRRGGPDWHRLSHGHVRYSKAVVRAWLKQTRVDADWPKRLHKRDALKAA